MYEQMIKFLGVAVKMGNYKTNRLKTLLFSILVIISMFSFSAGCSTETANVPGESGEENLAVISAIKDYASPIDVEQFIVANENKPVLISASRNDRLIPGRGLPQQWLDNSYHKSLLADEVARKGDFLVLQAVLVNNANPTEIKGWTINSEVNALDLILKNNTTCLSLEGIDYLGNPFSKAVNIDAYAVKSFWFGIQLDDSFDSSFAFNLSLSAADGIIASTSFLIDIDAGESIGDDDSKNLTRLKWLNSTIGERDEVTAPYIPVEFKGDRVDILGRAIQIGKNGLPSQIFSYFNSSNTEILENGTGILARPFTLTSTGEKVDDFNVDWSKKDQQNTVVKWSGSKGSWSFAAEAEFDGFTQWKTIYNAKTSVKMDSTVLSFSLKPEFSKYAMGMGLQGGNAPDYYEWKWDTTKHQDALWLGGVNGGVMIRLKGNNFERPLVNAYYDYKNLNLPESWGNEGKGSVIIKRQEDGSYLFTASCGSHSLNAGESLGFNFDLFLTPFKPLDTNQQWEDRYFHLTPGSKADMPDLKMAADDGANVINIHHNREYNPFINYPYNDYTTAELSHFVSDAHDQDMRVKMYYTTREITNNLSEFFMLYSLDGEIIYPREEGLDWPVTNSSGPHPWLTSNLGSNFVPAWRETLRGRFAGLLDLAVITTPDSRWNNFYLEGLDYLIDKTSIDGLYIDDTALDRKSMRRARRILDDKRPEARIDMHSWNHYNGLAGYASCSIVFMELYPYYDRLWHGEAFDYQNTTEDYWLVEMSGIPFGLMSEMLQNGGNQWRGLVFGETNRRGWHMPAGQPMNIWKLFDDFDIYDSTFMGWWDDSNPVKLSDGKIKCSVYQKEGKVMLALASWSKGKSNVSIDVDWEKLGMDPSKVVVRQPVVKGFQKGKKSVALNGIKIAPKKGVVLIIDEIQ